MFKWYTFLATKALTTFSKLNHLKRKVVFKLIRHNKVNGTQDSYFDKSLTKKQVKVFIFLFEKNFFTCQWFLLIIIVCCTLPCVLQITDTLKYNIVA